MTCKRIFLDEIIRVFSEHWFQGWGATPEEQRVKFSHIAQHVVNDTNYETQVVNIPDKQNIQLPLFSKNLTTMAVQKPST